MGAGGGEAEVGIGCAGRDVVDDIDSCCEEDAVEELVVSTAPPVAFCARDAASAASRTSLFFRRSSKLDMKKPPWAREADTRETETDEDVPDPVSSRANSQPFRNLISVTC